MLAVAVLAGGVLSVAPATPAAAAAGVGPPCIASASEIRCSPLYPLPPLCARCPRVLDLELDVVLPPWIDQQLTQTLANGFGALFGSYDAVDSVVSGQLWNDAMAAFGSAAGLLGGAGLRPERVGYLDRSTWTFVDEPNADLADASGHLTDGIALLQQALADPVHATGLRAKAVSSLVLAYRTAARADTSSQQVVWFCLDDGQRHRCATVHTGTLARMVDVRAHARPCYGPQVVCEDVFGDLWLWLWQVMHLGVSPLVQSAQADDPEPLFADAMAGFATAVELASGIPIPSDGTPLPARPGVQHPVLDVFTSVAADQAPGTFAGMEAVADGLRLLRDGQQRLAEARFRAAATLLVQG